MTDRRTELHLLFAAVQAKYPELRDELLLHVLDSGASVSQAKCVFLDAVMGKAGKFDGLDRNNAFGVSIFEAEVWTGMGAMVRTLEARDA